MFSGRDEARLFILLVIDYLTYGFDVNGFHRGVNVSTIVKHRQKCIGSETKNVYENDDAKDQCDTVPSFPHHRHACHIVGVTRV